MSNPTNPIPTSTAKQNKAASAVTDAVLEQADIVRDQVEQSTKGAQKVLDASAATQTKTADSLTDAARQQADIVREQTEQTARNAQKVFDTYVDASMSSFRRSQELAEQSYKAWTDSLRGGAGNPGYGLPTPDLREVVSASFDFAQGLLNAQREIAIQLVEALTPAGS